MRPLTLTLALLAGASVVGGAIAGSRVADEPPPTSPPATARLDVSRRVDPSMDRYMSTPKRVTPLARMNGAQRWISDHARPLVVHDSDPTVSLNTVGWRTRPRVAVYVNATGVNPFRPAAVQGARRWLVRKNGVPVKVDDWWMLDIRQPAARRWWLYGTDGRASCTPDRDRRGALDLIACGYRGLWVDNVLTVPDAWFKPDPQIDAGEWGRALVALLGELRAGLPSGVPFTINAHWTDLDFGYAPNPSLPADSPFVQAARLADQLVIEGGAIDPGLDYGAPVETQWSYRRLLRYADAMHAAGVRVQWEMTGSTDLTRRDAQVLGALPSCRDGDSPRAQPAWRTGDAIWRAHVRAAAFNFASALLTLAPGDSVGDMCEYPGRGWHGYAADLGVSTGARFETGPLIVREFSGGTVAVNPSTAAAPYTLPPGRSGINLASTASATEPAAAATFTVGPRSAVVVRFAAPATTAAGAATTPSSP